MSLKLAARLVTFPPYKIADLQENDVDIHIEDLSSILPGGTKAILIVAQRISGTGLFHVYPMSGATITLRADSFSSQGGTLVPIVNRELKWVNSVANDDWDIQLLGYFVQKRTR